MHYRIHSRQKFSQYVAISILVCVSLLLASMSAYAQNSPDLKALRICADGNNMPYSNDRREGYENRIAELFGDSLGLPVEYTYYPQRMGFIRNTLRKLTGPNEYACDIVMGVPEKFDMGTANTKPYYRSAYVLAYVKGTGFDDIKTAADIAARSEEYKDSIRMGIFNRGPGQLWAFRNGLMDTSVGYQSEPGDARVTVGDIMNDLAAGEKINMTIIWGPYGGWWAQELKKDGIDVAILPLTDDDKDPNMQFEFNMSMAVRAGDRSLKELLESLIDKHQVEILSIIDEYNVPLLPMNQTR